MPARVLLAAATSGLLAGCSGPLSTLEPAGPAAASIALLWWVMFAGAVVLTGFTLGLLWLSYVRPALLASFGKLFFIAGLGIAMPAAVLTLLLWSALAQGERLLPGGSAEAPVQIEVTAKRWAWDFAYPDNPGAPPTRNLVRMPAGIPVEFVVSSEDVVHSFWIPRLGGKIDAVPGHVNRIRLLADEPGRYHGVCAEFCGAGHAGMRFEVEALPEEQFRATSGEAP